MLQYKVHVDQWIPAICPILSIILNIYSNFNIRRRNFNLLIAYCLFRKFEVNFMLESIIHVIYALKKVYLSTKYVISSVPEPSFFGWIRSRTFLIFVFLPLLIKLLMLVMKYIIWSRELEPKPTGFQKARGRTYKKLFGFETLVFSWLDNARTGQKVCNQDTFNKLKKKTFNFFTNDSFRDYR